MRWTIIGRASVMTLAAAVAAGCGSKDEKKNTVPLDAGDGSTDAAPPGKEGDGQSPLPPMPEGGSPPEDSSTPPPDAATPDVSVPDAALDNSAPEAAGPIDASADISMDARLDAGIDAAPEAGLCSGTDGGLASTISCGVLQPGAFYDPARNVVVVDPQGLFQLDGLPPIPTLYGGYPEVEVRQAYRDQGSTYNSYDAPTAAVVAGGLVEYQLSTPPGPVTEVEVLFHRALLPDASLQVGLATLTFPRPGYDGGVLDGGTSGDGGGPPWPATSCSSLMGPAIVNDCSEVGTATYNPQTGALVLSTPFDVTGFSLYEYGPSLGSPISTAPTRVGGDLVWQVPDNPNRDQLEITLDTLLGPCNAPYAGTIYVYVDSSTQPPPQDAGTADAGDAAVQQFWGSTCEYEKFFEPQGD